VDDDEELCVELSEIFEDEGLCVTCFHDGLEARRFLDGHPVSLVLLDLKIPGMNGIDFLESLSNMKHPPAVVVITGRPLRKDFYAQQGEDITREKQILERANAVVNKPFDIAALVRLVLRKARSAC
jgi:CheY-like chemotaxis protein